jgi:hypothetical protein
MKRLLLLLAFSILHSSFSVAQEWFPVGAKWTYGWSWSIGGPPIYYPTTYEVVKDTLYLGKQCKLISRIDSNAFNPLNYPNRFFYDSAGVVFYASNGQWNLLYDFNKDVGDTIVYPQFQTVYMGNTVTYSNIITSKSTVAINGQTLRRYTAYPGPEVQSAFSLGTFATGATEVISWLVFFRPDIDDTNPEGLRCYEDSILGFYQNPNFNLDCDTSYTFVGLTDGLENKSSIKVYPISAENYLSVSILTESSERGRFKIYDLNGKDMKTYELSTPSSTLDISNLKTGIYIWEYRSAENRVRDKLIIRR